MKRTLKKSGKMLPFKPRTKKLVAMALLPPSDSSGSSSEEEERVISGIKKHKRQKFVHRQILPAENKVTATLADIHDDVSVDIPGRPSMHQQQMEQFSDTNQVMDPGSSVTDTPVMNLGALAVFEQDNNVAIDFISPSASSKQSVTPGSLFTSSPTESSIISSVRKPSSANRSQHKIPPSKISSLHRYQWETGSFESRVTGVSDSWQPTFETNRIRKPWQYFSDFFTNDVFDLIIEQTILYSAQNRANPIDINKIDLKNFIGILIKMGEVDMPSYTDFWSDESRFERIASVMPLKKFQSIRRYIHFVNNEHVNNDRYFKIRPIVNIIRNNFLKIEEEKSYSIDEMMVPYKGTRAGSRRQYIKNKPQKWGFKIFVRAGVTGFIYDFLIYGGEDTFRDCKFSKTEELLGLGGKVVIALCSSIKSKPCSFVYYDNFFTSLELMILLRQKYGIFSLGTIRNNRLRGCPLADDKTLKKHGRGSYSMRVCNVNKICVVKWLDNKCVCLASTFCEVEPLGTIQRHRSKKERSEQHGNEKLSVKCPHIIKKYNAFMGGVDLANMMIALYRTPLHTHRWYLAIFSQLIDMCLLNGWLLYRRDCNKLNIKSIRFKKFRHDVADHFMKIGKPKNIPKTENIIKNPRNLVVDDSRYDQFGHFPMPCEKGRCRLCRNGQTRIECMKCLARLCLTKDKNCFYNFHQHQQQ